METIETRIKLQCPIYDFRDGLLVTKLPDPLVVKEGKRKVKIDRFIARPFNKQILDLMYRAMQYTYVRQNTGVEYISTTDHEIAMINSYLKYGVIDDSYNNVTNNPCYFTQRLKDKINRLWNRRHPQKKTKK